MIPGIFHNVFFDVFLSAIILIFAGLTFIASHREPVKTTFGSYEDRALVIVPCKGRDYTLDENLRGIMANLNANWGAVAVVDSEDARNAESIPLPMFAITADSQGRDIMGDVAVVLKILPESADVSMEDLLGKIREKIKPLCEINKSYLEEIGFGLKAIKFEVIVPDEEGKIDRVEEAISAINGVAQVDSEDVTLV